MQKVEAAEGLDGRSDSEEPFDPTGDLNYTGNEAYTNRRMTFALKKVAHD